MLASVYHQLTERRHAEAEVTKINEALEERVAQRYGNALSIAELVGGLDESSG
jgi:hypothetical protein